MAQNFSMPALASNMTGPSDTLALDTPQIPQEHRANATLVMLCRNSELEGVVTSVQQMEDKFNKKYNYPWVFLNDEPFTDNFKKLLYPSCLQNILTNNPFGVPRRVSVLTDAPISFGVVPREHWYQPDWIDEGKAQAGRNKMLFQGIIYAGKHVAIYVRLLHLSWNW